MTETGWRWPPPPPITQAEVGSPAEFARLRMVRSLDQWLEEERVEAAVEELVAVGRTFQPHLLGGEMFMACGGIAAEVLGVPFAVMGWPAMRTQLSGPALAVAEEAKGRLSRLLAKAGAQGVNWEMDGPPALLSPHLHLTYWSPRWFAGLTLLPQTAMVGGKAPPPQPWKTPWLSQLPMDRPWIFITLGTSFRHDPNFFIAAANAAVQVGGIPILALGEMNPEIMAEIKPKLPQPIVLTSQVNFQEVLPYAAGAIHHGGAGTTHALITHAVPQIVVPHAADQARQAEGVARAQVGYRLAPQQVTIPILVQMLTQILPHSAPARQNARTLKDEFASLGGVTRAAELLEGVIG
jgi:UDP:flavonoid glycosyltransferase YjiC (YdhE family)